jgi:hypothetical protein
MLSFPSLCFTPILVANPPTPNCHPISSSDLRFLPHLRGLYDKMATGSIIDQRFTDWINEATDLADQGQLEECVVKARELLARDDCPRYHRMKTLLLLAAALDD